MARPHKSPSADNTSTPKRKSRKGELQEALEESFNTLPRAFAEELFQQKLTAAGIEPEGALVDKLVDHVLNNIEADFEWPADHPASQAAIERILNITDEDMADLDRRFDRFSKQELPEIVTNIAETAGASLLRRLKRNWSDQRTWEKQVTGGFRDRLELRWCKAFTALRMLLTISVEMGGEAYEKRRRSRAKRNIYRTDVLIRLHARACQVTGEILALMEAGYADGAMARWRTLHEIAVVATLIAEHGDELAERYLAHEVVESKRALVLYSRTYKDLGYGPPSATEIGRVDALHSQAVAHYGRDFANPNGWAAKHLGIANPNFSQLEEAAGRFRMRSHYKMASYNVHAGVKGITYKLGSMGAGPAIVAGPSNAGLDEPGQNAAITLSQITFLLIGPGKQLDELVIMWAFAKLQADAVEAFVRAGRKLKREVGSR